MIRRRTGRAATRVGPPRRRRRGHSHGRPRRQERECKGTERTRGRRRRRGRREQFSACRSPRQLRTRRPPTATPASYARAPLAQAGAATRAPLHKHGAQGQRPTAPKSLQRRRHARCSLKRQCPRTPPHRHPAAAPPPRRSPRPVRRRRNAETNKILMTAPDAKTRKHPRCSCLLCATQHQWAAASSSSSLKEAPQTPDAANKRGKTPLS